MHEGKALVRRASLLMVLKPRVRFKCMKTRPLLRDEPVDGAEACVKAEMHKGKALHKRTELLMV